MTIRRAPLREAPPLPVDWHIVQRRRDFGPPHAGAFGRAALFVFVALAVTYIAGWLLS